MESVFEGKLVSQRFKPEYNEANYFERTRRNHYWVGGAEGQARLKNLKVGIAGLGGMGSNLAEIFVRLGAGHIKIADPDIIELSNLNRQVIANQKTIGQKKAIAAANELRLISNDFELDVYDDGITEENVEEFVSDLDIIIDEIDVFPFRPHVWLHRAANKKNIPLYSGFIIGLGTHIYKFQGNEYTFEDFMKHNDAQIDRPDSKFMMDRLFNPPPSYLNTQKQLLEFGKTIDNKTVPIFGATTFASHSIIAIRVINDFLDLNSQLGGVHTPQMPRFIKFDPFDLNLQVCDMRELGSIWGDVT